MGKEVKPGVVLVIAILCIMIIGPLCFWLGKQFSNKEDVKDKEQKEETVEVADDWIRENKVMSIAAAGKNFVFLTEDGKEIRLDDRDAYDNIEYFYTDKKVYTYDFSGENNYSSELGYFDLNDNNKYKKIASLKKETIPESIIVLKDHVYISLAGKKYIIDYDLKENESTELYYFDDYFSIAGHGSFLLYAVDGQAYYMTRGTTESEPEFGSIDLETGKKEKITNVGYVNYIYRGKFVFNHDYYENSKYMTTYYEYDTKTKKVSPISEPHVDFGGSIYDSMIIPVDDYYIYYTGDAIYKYENGKEEKLLNGPDEGNFDSFVKTSKDTITLYEGGRCEFEENLDECNYKVYIYNIKDNKLERAKNDISADDLANVYDKVMYLN